ncbi:PREDICTED: uncharacterized protein LOC105115052 isoform X2 [Populus euphratica]|uniref:Uncharacterized protein LOC105115052 isoform X2 n=1 Tax=Populus euphratica TaxID=75702 RepID=A0AAJ6TFT0_POPEU|nr:PREDICTED: uncharacterized protein LOC105115052 isoform X2 [Populus euphratica]
MAQFTVQGRLKLLFDNDGTHCKLLGNDFLGGLRSSLTQKRKIRFLGANSTKLYAAASLSKKSKHFYTEASQSVSEASDESDEDYDSERDELACFRGLVLDISYRPVNVVCWKRAMCLEFMEKVPHLLQVVKRRRIFRSKLSRKNILHRDNYTCQYCSSHENLTIDHVLPTAQGGEWQWENLVTACAKCNSKKGQKTPEEANMKLSKVPKAPKDYDILAIPLTSAAIRMLRMRKGMPEEWQQYLARPSSEP